MTWTTQKPTVPGWYWYREDGIGPEVMDVDYRAIGETDAEAQVLVAQNANEYDVVENMIGEWAGPIDLPEEP